MKRYGIRWQVLGRWMVMALLITGGVMVVPAEANRRPAAERQGLFAGMNIPERELPQNGVVRVLTNRWKPDRCMWVVKKEDLQRENLAVVFPFAELSNAVCHILVGVSQKRVCFIHLTPLTSFFRRDTSELKKIIANLKDSSDPKEKWEFQVYYFDDGGREEAFRMLINKVLGRGVGFTALRPAAYEGGEINLIHAEGRFSYTVAELREGEYRDASGHGDFNRIPIAAFE